MFLIYFGNEVRIVKSNLDIWAVQEDGTEVFTALKNIKKGLSIVYKNCCSRIRIGDYYVKSRLFDVALYNEEADVLILIMKNSPASSKDMIDYLEANNLEYVEVTFNSDYCISEDATPELWFARDRDVLKDALCDSVSHGYESGIFYPNMWGDLAVGYQTEVNGCFSIDGRIFTGAVLMPDKFILFVSQSGYGKRSINYRDVDLMARASGVWLDVSNSKKVNFESGRVIKNRKLRRVDK